MWNRIDLKMRAKAALGRNYWVCVGTAFVLLVLTRGLSVVAGTGSSTRYTGDFDSSQWEEINSLSDLWVRSRIFRILVLVISIVAVFTIVYSIFVGNVIQVGGCRFFTLNQTEQVNTKTLFSMFRSGGYSNIVVTMFLMNLYITLWSLLFFFPGIIKSYEYRMVPYILAENPSMDRREAFAISKRMMQGKKWATFVFDLSFLGWDILSSFTFGLLAFFFVIPYKYAADAEVYTANRAIAFEEGYIH